MVISKPCSLELDVVLKLERFELEISWNEFETWTLQR